MINNVYIDIETIPRDTFYKDEIAESVKPPANYSKPESIAQWWAEKGQQAKDDAVHSLGLMPAYNQIVSLSWAWDEECPTTYSGEHEAAILLCFIDDLSEKASKARNGYSMRFVGHNLIGFDLPCIWWACIRNDVPYSFLPHPRQIKPWETMKAVDTLYQLAGTERKGYSLANMAKLFGIPDPMPDMDGSKVWELYKQGKYREIGDYNQVDVEITRQLYRRIKQWL